MGKGRHFAITAAVWAAFSLTPAAGPLAEEEVRTPRQIVYDYAVTSYCGLLTPEVELGFQRELKDVTRQRGLSPQDAKALRIAGWVDADREWRNRGLGGYRAWCREDGLTAARHFLDVARESGGP